MRKIIYGLVIIGLMGCGAICATYSIDEVDTKFVERSLNSYSSSWTDRTVLDLAAAYSLSDVAIRIEVSAESRTSSSQIACRISLFSKAHAGQPCPVVNYDSYIRSIRVFNGATSNTSLPEGTELTNRMKVIGDLIAPFPEVELEQWNEIDKVIPSEDFNSIIPANRHALASIAFDSQFDLSPGSYEFQILVELENGDLFDITTPAITIR